MHKCGSTYRSSHQKCFWKKGVLINFAKFRPQACSLIKKETLAHVFFCEFWEISKNTFLIEHLWASASAHKIFQKTQNSNHSYVTFLWRHCILRRSLKLSIFMNKSNFPYKMKWLYNTRSYWKCVIRKANTNFFSKPSWLKIQLIWWKITLVVRKCWHLKNQFEFWKNSSEYQSQINFSRRVARNFWGQGRFLQIRAQIFGIF